MLLIFSLRPQRYFGYVKIARSYRWIDLLPGINLRLKGLKPEALEQDLQINFISLMKIQSILPNL